MDIYIYMKDNSGIISIVASNIRIYMYIFVARNIKKEKLYVYMWNVYKKCNINIMPLFVARNIRISHRTYFVARSNIRIQVERIYI